MLWFIIFPILVPFHFLGEYIGTDFKRKSIFIAPCALIGLIIAMIANIICTVPVCIFCKHDYQTVNTTEIYALNDNIGAQGKFFLGSGHVNGDAYYYYIEETDVGKHIASIPANNAYICESNSETPRIEMQQMCWEKSWVKWILITNWFETRYMIYIPENSVTTDFNVDLSNGSFSTPSTSTSSSGENSYCSDCGKELSPGDKFCSGCGKKMEVS